jgi:catechol 2,3-dioxygenase-like lactoylglutathione lyase family enzyme
MFLGATFSFREDLMRRYIHDVALFAGGGIAVLFFMNPSHAQDDRLTGIRINHVGIFAKDWDETINFYTKTLGFKEAFTFKDKDGNVTTSYIQMNKDNFLEIARATPERPAGLNHVGIWVDDIKATVAALRKRGVKVDDPRAGNSKAPLTNVTDPNGIRLELLEFTPESSQRKAIESWK